MCLNPRLIYNPKYLPNKKNNYNPPECHDERMRYVPIGCGRCIECMKKRKRHWQVRLHEEIKSDNTGKFVTLTFNEEKLDELEKEAETTEANEIATLAVRRFTKRWIRKYGKSIKHWLITELGHENTERIHLHGILWTEKTNEEIEERWQYGNIYVGQYVNEKTINYIVKYVTKIDSDHKNFQGKILPSPGIGKGFLNKWDAKQKKFKGEETDTTFRLPNGYEVDMPIYYRNYIYTEQERELLWGQILDKQERWVMGHKIDVSTSKGEIEYENALNYYQTVNKRLNYDTEKWEKKKYETRKKELRNLQEHKKLTRDQIIKKMKT